MSEITDLVMPTLIKMQEQMSSMQKDIKRLDMRIEVIEQRSRNAEQWSIHAVGLGTIAKGMAEQSLA